MECLHLLQDTLCYFLILEPEDWLDWCPMQRSRRALLQRRALDRAMSCRSRFYKLSLSLVFVLWGLILLVSLWISRGDGYRRKLWNTICFVSHGRIINFLSLLSSNGILNECSTHCFHESSFWALGYVLKLNHLFASLGEIIDRPLFQFSRGIHAEVHLRLKLQFVCLCTDQAYLGGFGIRFSKSMKTWSFYAFTSVRYHALYPL